MKVFYKKHFFEGDHTWLVVHFDKPIRDSDGRLLEGRVNIQVGREEQIKGVFKMSIDECRALIDALKNTIKTNDELITSLLNPPGEVEVYDKQEPIGSYQEPDYRPEGSLTLFENDEETEEQPEKPKVYY